MKKSIKKILINLAIIVIFFLIAFLVLKNPKPQTTEEIARCIGENAVLYTQLGCHGCEIQKEVFGENYLYLTKVDCFFEKEKCPELTGTPTWKIKNKLYKGVQSVEKLQELTGC